MNEVSAKLPEQVPIFPLPEVVLFPRQVLPLHIFEPRYRTMVVDALAGDKILAIALLKPNYEPHYFTSHAPIYGIVGVGRIIAAELVDDHKYNILVRGEGRAKIAAEIRDRSYRVARIQSLNTRCNSTPAARAELKRELLEAVRQYLQPRSGLREQYGQLLEAPLSLGELADVIAAGLPITGQLRQALLAQLDVCVRVRMLLDHIRALGAVACQARRSNRHAVWELN